MSAVLVVGLVQYTQILLHRFPDWRADMKTAGRVWRLCVHFTLLACLGLTGAWLVGWVGMQLGLVLVDLGQVDVQELGLIVIVAWTVWVAVLAVVLCGNATSLSPKDHGLRLFFQNLKTSFIVTVSFFFLRGCLSPTMGFIDAQQELTILTIFIPILYVALYTTVNAALQLSMGLVVFGGPAALVMSVQLCRLSDFGGPGTFVVVFLHIFIKLIGLFGDDALTKIETDAYDEDDVAPRDPLRPARPIPGRALSPLATEIVPTEGVTPAVDTSAKGTAGATAVEREAQGGRGIGERGGPSGSERQESPSSGDRAAKPIGGIVTGAAGRRPERERGQGNAERIGVEGEMRKPAGSIPGESNGGRRAGGGSAHADAGGPAGHRGRDVKCERGYGRRSREDLAGHVEPGKPGPGINGRGVDIHLGHTVDLDRKIPCMSLVSDSPRSASASPSVGLLRRRLHSPSRSRDVQPKQHTRSPSRPGVPRSVGRASLGAEGITLGDGGTSGERDIGRLTPGTSQNREVAARVGGRGLGRAGWWDTTDGSSKQGSQYGVLRGRMHSRPLPPSGRGQPHRERGVSWGDGDEMIGLGPAGRGKPVDAEGSSHAGALHELDRSLHETERAVSTLPSSPPCERCIRRSYSMDDVLVFGTRGRVEWEDWGGARTTRFDFGAGRRGKSFEDRSSKKVESPGSPAEEGRWGNPPSGSGAPHGSRRLGFNEWVLSVLGGNRSVLAAIETNARFVFKGTVRGVCTLLVVLSLFLGGFQILSLMQEEKQWYPSLIKLSTTPEEQVVVDNAFVVKATLETRGDAVVVEPRYASCGSTWNGLSLIDYALLAELAYFDQHDPEVPLSEVATHFFPPNVTGLDFEIKVPDGENSYAQFFEAYSAKLNISVVAIRGTDVGRISDLIEDLKIWVEPIVLKCLSVVFPTIRIWPDSTSSTVIEWLHETLQLFGLQQQVRSANAFQVSRKLSPLSLAHYYRPLVEYVRAIKGRNIVLTGHSLGGGLARIVGALEKAPSICFSPPGIAQSYRKFSVGAGSLDRAFLHQMSVSVIPEHDFVPMIDTQVGLIQLISCSTAGKALQLSCHMLEGTICDLIKHCGDDRGRFTDCKFEYNMSHLLPHLLGYLEGRMIWVACSGAMLLIFAVLVVLPEFLA